MSSIKTNDFKHLKATFYLKLKEQEYEKLLVEP
jgi:hypothetical protein